MSPRAPASAAPAQAPHTIPLEAITITVTRDAHYLGEKPGKRYPVTITGRQLAPILGWLVRLYPDPTAALDMFGDPEQGDLLLEGAAAALSAGARAELDMGEAAEILDYFSGAIHDYVNRQSARREADSVLREATVTIGATAKGAAA